MAIGEGSNEVEAQPNVKMSTADHLNQMLAYDSVAAAKVLAEAFEKVSRRFDNLVARYAALQDRVEQLDRFVEAHLHVSDGSAVARKYVLAGQAECSHKPMVGMEGSMRASQNSPLDLAVRGKVELGVLPAIKVQAVREFADEAARESGCADA